MGSYTYDEFLDTFGGSPEPGEPGYAPDVRDATDRARDAVVALMALPVQELRQHDRLVRRGRTQEVADVLVSNCVYVSFFDGSTETFRIGETVDIQRGGLR